MAACAQIDGPMRSFYIWNDELEDNEEYRITFKFLSENSAKLEAWLKDNHSAAIPQWIMLKPTMYCPHIWSGPSLIPAL